MGEEKGVKYSIGEWEESRTLTWTGRLYVAGDVNAAEMVCRQHALKWGMCVSIHPVKYIFTGGTEDGVEILLFRYVPFPDEENIYFDKLVRLGKAVAEASYQWSFSIVTDTRTYFYSRRRK